jgi:hypothetical protein
LPNDFSYTERTLEDFVNQLWQDHPPMTRKDAHQDELNKSHLSIRKYSQEDGTRSIGKSRQSLNPLNRPVESSKQKALTSIEEDLSLKPKSDHEPGHHGHEPLNTTEPSGPEHVLPDGPPADEKPKTPVASGDPELDNTAGEVAAEAKNEEAPPAAVAAPPPPAKKKGLGGLFGKKK